MIHIMAVTVAMVIIMIAMMLTLLRHIHLATRSLHSDIMEVMVSDTMGVIMATITVQAITTIHTDIVMDTIISTTIITMTT